MPMMNIKGDWDLLAFGIIMIFIGIGFKIGKKVLKRERIQ
jgi:NADH:ubiquinone oxidoreductase subunit 2 (subunit N)